MSYTSILICMNQPARYLNHFALKAKHGETVLVSELVNILRPPLSFGLITIRQSSVATCNCICICNYSLAQEIYGVNRRNESSLPNYLKSVSDSNVKGIPRCERRYGGSLAQVASEEHRDCMYAAETFGLGELLSRICNHHMLVHIEGTALEPHKNRPIRKQRDPFILVKFSGIPDLHPRESPTLWESQRNTGDIFPTKL